jgi:aldose sugar dehydrogenase
MNHAFRIFAAGALVAGCNSSSGAGEPGSTPQPATPVAQVETHEDEPRPDVVAGPTRFEPREVARFREPWAMTFLPDGQLVVTEKVGTIRLMSSDGELGEIRGAPEVDHGGQGGLGDFILHPDFGTNQLVYLSWAEAGRGDVRGAAVGRARLALDDEGGGSLEDLEVIWRQVPKTTGRGHYAHRLAFDGDGYLFITSGDRQKLDPAQEMDNNLGTIVRLHDDGSIPDDNPFAEQAGVTAQIWTYGHRNPLGIAFDAQGRLWVHEMGPRHGDELNLIEPGQNYGWPVVSDGDHYDGRPIPDHDTRPEFAAPAVSWVPAISPAGFIIYDGDVFPAWRGSGFLGGLSSQALIRVEFEGDEAREAERWEMGERIREVAQGPEGGIWVLEDERRGSGGRLLYLEPVE